MLSSLNMFTFLILFSDSIFVAAVLLIMLDFLDYLV